MKITVLTPTYNRNETLSRLYKSLKNQTSLQFEWLVVDDGSSDETKLSIEKMTKEANFPIRYIYKSNGGKHTALNRGINSISSELTFIVDSDDWLDSAAIATILHYYDEYKNEQEICGFAFLRAFPDGKINGKTFDTDEKIASYIDARINYNDTCADKAEVFFTKCLKEFPFPEYEGERFLGEDIVWIRMARKYNMVHINKAIYIGDYQTDGLTNNRRRNNIKSPIGCMNRAKEFISEDMNFKYRIKGTLQYIIYGKFAGYKIGSLLKECKSKFLILSCYLPALILYCKWKYTTK